MDRPRRRLSELLAGWCAVPAEADRGVTELALDSRAVRSGMLFLAVPGAVVDGRAYIDRAIAAGAAAVVAEGEPCLEIRAGVPVIHIDTLSTRLGELAGRFFSQPSRQLDLIGVTGTNGKTTTTQLLARVLTGLGKPCAVMGTIGYGVPGALVDSPNTTPNALSIQRFLAQMLAQGVQAAAIEVSSHGLVQGRVAGLRFAAGVFTNLTQDHLDYHGTMQAYGEAKRLLFLQPELGVAVINADDPFGHHLLGDPSIRATKYAYGYSQGGGASGKLPAIFAERFAFSDRGISARLRTPWGEGELNSNLLGAFNLSNLLAVVATLGALGHPLDAILAELAKPQSVPGRMECYGGGDKPLAVVDYAHTPDALEQALKALRGHCRGRLWCVFGCGGDRDRSKRPLMAAIAEACADRVLVTNDNPRTEDPQAILADIRGGLKHPEQVVVELDRAAAIALALSQAQAGDVVLIAGKGHEEYQIMGKDSLDFSDAREVRRFFEN
ncbi:MAG: UDP-N-acetylmuramoyl-L-alanyl-D-glutamate--2,6-diaminopimelate ligase [Gammaproteobacteria bacterium]|nr:UDP-N-acetylmuramoyl-L-alanyl-D-glutamate--2,6-diaminopimelate ligase [Gammaproteobacteria bacterium]